MCKVVQDVLKEVEVQEPRFISSLTECNGRYEGLDVVSPGEFEVVLYLNQMGAFKTVPNGGPRPDLVRPSFFISALLFLISFYQFRFRFLFRLI